VSTLKNNIENFTIKSKKDDLNLSLIKVTPKDKKIKRNTSSCPWNE